MIEAALLAAVVAAGSTQAAAETSGAPAAFHALLGEDWEARLREDPLLATSTGDHRYDDRLPSVAPADLERAAQRQRATLARLGDIARASLDTLKGTVLGDHAAITNAELNVEFTSIRSPVDGVTGNLLVYPGNIVKAPDDSMLMIHQIHPIYVSFAVPEQDLSVIKKELRERTLNVGATFQNMRAAAPKGQLTFIDNAVDPTTGMIQLKATFPNQNNALWPGQFVQVAVTLSTQPHAVVVPSPAVQTGQKGQFIYVVKADQTVEMRPVTIGIARDGETVVESGLKAGETVVTDGQLRLVPGAKVNVQAAKLSDPAAAQSTAP